jgi:hypothetical protein
VRKAQEQKQQKEVSYSNQIRGITNKHIARRWLKELELYAGAPKTQKDGVVPVARINPRLIKKMLLLQESFLQQMAILPHRASMQRLMIRLLRIPERKDRLMSVRFKFQNAKTDQASNSRIPESKGSSSLQRTVEIRISRKQRLIELRISRMQRQS